LGSALAVGVLAAIFPSWQASRVAIAEALRRVG
jgi:ABC-type antimicrobial peptide transport system permease subunit